MNDEDMGKIREYCVFCVFWQVGRCRKRAPVVITDGYEIGCVGHLTVWAETGPEEWCGDFKEKTEKEVE